MQLHSSARPEGGQPNSTLASILSFAAASLGTGLALACVLYCFAPGMSRDYAEEQEAPRDATQPKVELFKGWFKPDVALVLTGQQFGYHQPCGCSSPQYGGLARRFTFMTGLRQKGWPVVAVDLGDVADEAKRRNPQSLLKYTTSLQALKLLGYTAVGIGLNEMHMPLSDCLSDFPLNNPTPRIVAANLLGQKDPGEAFHGMVKPWEIGGGRNKVPRVGVLGWIAPSVEDQVKDAAVKFAMKSPEVLAANLDDLAAKDAELIVLLYQGTEKEARKAAEWLAAQRKKNLAFPLVNVILHQSEDDNPAGTAQAAGDSLLIGVGHKGKYVGVLGARRTGLVKQPFEFRYQLVSIGPEFETPQGKEGENPILTLMDTYAQELVNQKLFNRFPRGNHPTQNERPGAKYVGSERCMSCHDQAYSVWEKSGHAHAYDTLVKAKRPKHREFDGECIVCHTVGFKYDTGFADAVKTPHLKDVGCESCHGPASDHVAKSRDTTLYPLINPWKTVPAAHRNNRIDQFCQQCHDIDNDVHWNFAKAWPKVVHGTVRKDKK